MSAQSDDTETIRRHCDEWSYCPGDGFMYSIRSALGKSIIRRLGLAHMSDEWKEYILANYETKRPERRPRYSPSRGHVLFGGGMV